MDIFETLRIEHAAVRRLLDDLIEKTDTVEASPDDVATSEDDWPVLFHDLKLTLLAHDRAEEAVFYDALRNIPHRSELADIKTEEHHLVEELLEDLEEINPADDQWSTKLALLKNQIESHIAEEETMVFSVLEPVIDEEKSLSMVTEFESLRDDIMQAAQYHPKGRSAVNPAGLDLDT